MRSRLAVLVLLFLIAGKLHGQTGSSSFPDAIFYNGKVVTVDSASTIQQAFAVKGEEFVAVGTSAKVRTLAGKGTRLVDLKGATVIPGLSDNHDHLYNSGKYMRHGVDMVGVTSLPEMLRRLREAVGAVKPSETIFTTTGWRFQPGPTKKD